MKNEIVLYYSATPNGHKAVLMLEELGVPYQIEFIDIEKGDQFSDEFDLISPNNKIPAIVDHLPVDKKEPLSVFESGAILYYLADKYQRFLPAGARERIDVMQWVFWQMAGLGPMAGQAHHFIHYAPERIDYGINRYVSECARLYSVMNKQLEKRDYLANDYSIADMACWGWVMRHQRHHQNLDDFPNVKDWYSRLEQRPAVISTRKIAKGYQGVSTNVNEDTRQILFTSKTKR